MSSRLLMRLAPWWPPTTEGSDAGFASSAHGRPVWSALTPPCPGGLIWAKLASTSLRAAGAGPGLRRPGRHVSSATSPRSQVACIRCRMLPGAHRRAASPAPIGVRGLAPPEGPLRANPRLPRAPLNAPRLFRPLGARRSRAGNTPWLTVGLGRPAACRSPTEGTARTPISADDASTFPRWPASASTPRATSSPPGANCADTLGGLTTLAALGVTEPGSVAGPALWLFKLPPPLLGWLGPLIGASPSPPTSAAWT
jgi:hypothetical protein